ncbi:6-hydroxymethylpterin diphosphokinase MptE-like protein [Desulfosporosinus sp. OT]|uniref:motility associated factor glycosyltransferase family protein n=1 Tax=Desulfosporosinus sp. OT TaxID=913865 RepID=UPI000223A35E|nr:6-hydroxymethylpterin diphosphokinase MptE-like protein [Desulfosporosinus sp. OT]EGW36522.1 hypothetical protein DOT_5603 [Desulfosporosinus sp. OT]
MNKRRVSFNLSKAKNGMSTVSVQIDDHPEIFLHSTVDPIKEARDWLDRVELRPYTAYFVLGSGLGYHIQVLLENLPEGSHIYVLEYSQEGNLLAAASKIFPNSSWIHDYRISYWATDTLRDLAAALAVDMGKRCINRVEFCRYYPAMAVYMEFYKRIEEELVPKVEELFCLNFNNSIAQGIRRMENAWFNVPYISNSPGITAFANHFAGKPVIVVAAGPSLNKNIEVLRKCTDRAIVIAAGSTMGALFAHEIRPCFLAVADTSVAMYDVLAEVLDPGAILLAPYDVQHKVVSEYPGKRLFAVDGTTMTLKGVGHLLPDTEGLKANLSVATFALNFALHCGADPIIFVGQDLSFPSDPTAAQHAKGVRASGYLRNEQKTYVPGYDGGEVPTEPVMRDIIQYLETIIKLNPGTTFINATEGGAKISGTLQLKLSEVYDQLLTENILINGIADEVFSRFEAPSNTELLKVLLDIREDITRTCEVTEGFFTGVVREIEEGIEWSEPLYDRIIGQIVSFFEELSQESIYQHLKQGIAPYRELVEYRMREGMNFQQKIENYLDLKRCLLIVLERLDTAVHESVMRLKKMQIEMIEQNGREDHERT